MNSIKTIKNFVAVSVAVVGLFLNYASAQTQTPSASAVVGKKLSSPFIVTEVVDGDTVKLSNGETVRLIGVDTPETVHPTKPVEIFGREASLFTRRLLQGKQVRLEFDQDTRDRYQRVLAYLYLDDGTCANELIIASGYGYAYTQFPFKYMERYREIEKIARAQGRGLWATESVATAVLPATPYLANTHAVQSSAEQTVSITRTGKKYHTSSCRYVTASTAKRISVIQARAAGYTLCSVCGEK